MTAAEFAAWRRGWRATTSAVGSGAPGENLADRRVLVMGVLNVTPDSFSDGGRFFEPAAAAAHALEMVRDGADLIDIGGESTRPGSAPVAAAEQVRRIVPVIEAVRRASAVAISVDTTRSAVAAAALDGGADCINDISAGRDDPEMLALVARRAAPVVLMHMRGTPATMQINPRYGDVVAEVSAFLSDRLAAARAAGIDPADVLIDPGIGFGKTVEHNLQLLRALPTLAAMGAPVVVGASRKRFLRTLWQGPAGAPQDVDDSAMLLAIAATAAWAAGAGAAVVRVHDVGPISGVLRVLGAIRSGQPA
jgi:dihydropteroate synthase